MPFKYRLEKVLKIREEELDTAILEMKKAEDHLRSVSHQLSVTTERRNELHSELIREGISHATLYVRRIKQLNEIIAKLEKDLQAAQDALIKAKEEVVEAKMRLEALKRHRQKKHKDFVDEENRKERIMLDEIGVSKHARELIESREE
ncbi:MAG: flagellar FliJ family protein [Candidatus Melainabacteria bacterium]|nr:flagellar FliJ family protein [Candidatus Melainabacteria bacterium]